MIGCPRPALALVSLVLVAACAACSDEAAYSQIQAPNVSPPEILQSAEHGGPMTVEAVCLEVISPTPDSGRVEASAGDNERDLAGILDLLGVTAGSGGCDLTLQVSLSGGRLCAAYEGLGTCCTGEVVWAEVAALVAGEEAGSWSLESRSEPPGLIPESAVCPGPDVHTGGLATGKYVEVFENLFGQPGLVAARVLLANANSGGLTLDDGTIALLIRGWSTFRGDFNPRYQSLQAVRHLAEDGPASNRDVLLPHLIEALAHEELQDAEAVGWGLENELEQCLRDVTGQSRRGTAVEWWEWWEAQQGEVSGSA